MKEKIKFDVQIHKELDNIYRLYPRKMGKAQGMKVAYRSIKTLDDIEKLKLAVNRYRSYLLKNQTDPKYYLYWSTFMNQWTDWLEDSTGSVESNKVDKWKQLEER